MEPVSVNTNKQTEPEEYIKNIIRKQKTYKINKRTDN